MAAKRKRKNFTLEPRHVRRLDGLSARRRGATRSDVFRSVMELAPIPTSGDTGFNIGRPGVAGSAVRAVRMEQARQGANLTQLRSHAADLKQSGAYFAKSCFFMRERERNRRRIEYKQSYMHHVVRDCCFLDGEVGCDGGCMLHDGFRPTLCAYRANARIDELLGAVADVLDRVFCELLLPLRPVRGGEEGYEKASFRLGTAELSKLRHRARLFGMSDSAYARFAMDHAPEILARGGDGAPCTVLVVDWGAGIGELQGLGEKLNAFVRDLNKWSSNVRPSADYEEFYFAVEALAGDYAAFGRRIGTLFEGAEVCYAGV